MYQTEPPPKHVRKIKEHQYAVCMKKYPLPEGNIYSLT